MAQEIACCSIIFFFTELFVKHNFAGCNIFSRSAVQQSLRREDNNIVMFAADFIFCYSVTGLFSFFFGSFTYGAHNLKHMRVFDLLSLRVLRFPRVCMFADLCTHIWVCVCVCVVHGCTEKEGGASTHGLRHIVLITSPIGKETHPFPICCLPPVKIFFGFYNNSKRGHSCGPSRVKGENLCYQERSKIQRQGGLLGTEAAL